MQKAQLIKPGDFIRAKVGNDIHTFEVLKANAKTVVVKAEFSHTRMRAEKSAAFDFFASIKVPKLIKGTKILKINRAKLVEVIPRQEFLARQPKPIEEQVPAAEQLVAAVETKPIEESQPTTLVHVKTTRELLDEMLGG